MNRSAVGINQIPGGVDPRWRDLYRIGAIASIAFPIAIVLAIIAYFIWPYTPGFTSLENIYLLLQDDPLAGLMSLDLMMVIMEPILILHMLALYVTLKQENESYALIALVLGLIGNVLILTARPLAEMVFLSGQYVEATTEAARNQCLAAGETLHAIFNGTAWLWWNFLTGIAYTILSILMLRSRIFSKFTGYFGIALFVIGVGFWIPGIGLVLSLLATFGTVFWFAMQARPFIRLGWGDQAEGVAD
jgi:hypothetical protein